MSNLVDETIKLLQEQRYKVEEMADTIRDIKRRIESGRKQLIYHLIKYLLWNSVTTADKHWKQEIHDALFEMPLIKNRNKYPTQKQLMNWGFETAIENVKDHIDVYVEQVQKKEELELPNYNKDILVEFINVYLVWLCEELGNPNNKGVVSIDKVEKVIDYLYNKYYKLLIK